MATPSVTSTHLVLTCVGEPKQARSRFQGEGAWGSNVGVSVLVQLGRLDRRAERLASDQIRVSRS
jgi:hypothetical protein